MTERPPHGIGRVRRHFGADTLPIARLADRTPAWMLTPRAVRRPFLTDPPRISA
ncbi:hypothetical protein KGQ90_09825 [Modicisalibacter tunisiensis]|uniref:hypothetical protein n=1 Tax=Modicisalibacter tunisiensis TaxID=390637 RepID=UPI0007972F52|nr:hypothetical protein [Modicisalibacter tunisiensis]KXS39773.1 MAG: hypothetical protein AWU55_148 [Halomonadaceae bacterium T82-2]MBZ9539240.1 hypothetical protein [Modicisalibacter tunisiensis]